MNTINTPIEKTTHTEEETWGTSSENLAGEDQVEAMPVADTYEDTATSHPGHLDRADSTTGVAGGSPFGQEPMGRPEPLGAPVPAGQNEPVTTSGDPTDVEHSDEVLRIVHNPGEDKPWEIQYGDGINLFQKARAILNYPVHKFETEAKAQEVAEMLRGIIDADGVEQDGRVITREGVNDQGEFFHTVSEKGESPPGERMDSR